MAKKDIRISNLWDMLEFACGTETENGICGAKPEMEMSRNQVIYKCPVCGTITAYYDVEKFLEKISAIIVEDMEDGCETNLTNFKHTMMSRYDSKRHTFKVLSHTKTKLKVSLKNG